MNKPDTLYRHKIFQSGGVGSSSNPSRNCPSSTNQRSNTLLANENLPSYFGCGDVKPDRSTYHLLPNEKCSTSTGTPKEHYILPSYCSGKLSATTVPPPKSFHRSTPVLRNFPHQSPSHQASNQTRMFYPTNSKSYTSTYSTIVKPSGRDESVSPLPSIINVPVGVNLNSVATKSDLSQIFSQIARINDHLYLSSLIAITPDRLSQHGISLVVSAIGDKLPSSVRAPGVSNLHIPIEDVETANLRVHFDRVADRIYQEYKRGGRILVHCMAGVSRSSSLILAYLIKYQDMTLAKAYLTVKSARPFINPNRGFWKQLLDYEYQLHNEQTVNLVNSNIPQHSRNRQYERISFTGSPSPSPLGPAYMSGTNLPVLRRPSLSAGRRMYSYNGSYDMNNPSFISPSSDKSSSFRPSPPHYNPNRQHYNSFFDRFP